MRRLALVGIVLLLLFAACTRSQTSIQGPSRSEGAESEQLREISGKLPTIEQQVTIHEATEIVPQTENPFPEII